MTFVNSTPYKFPWDGSFNRETTALVIIDMRNDRMLRNFLLKINSSLRRGWVCPRTRLWCTISVTFLISDIAPLRKPIPAIQKLLEQFRRLKFPIYHTREGHRPDLSTIPARELFRSRNNPHGIGLGDPGPLGRLLIRGEKGWDIIPELYPLPNEPIIDKPTKGTFAYTDFELLLKVRGVKNLIFCGVCTDICVHTTMREAADRGYDCLLVTDACAATADVLHTASIEMIKTEGGIFGATCGTDELFKVLETMGAE